MSGPTERDLRDASLGRQLAALGIMGGMSSFQLREAVAAQSYTVAARTIGVDDEESQRVLREVVDELSTTGSSGDPYAIAQRRLCEGEGFRPTKELRDAARDLLAAHGGSLHPEDVDAQAWWLQRVTEVYAPRVPWYRRWWRRLRKMLRKASGRG